MKTLGMIGGTSWHSTIEYYRLLNQMGAEVAGNGSNPTLILYSIDISIMREMQLDKINAYYLEIAQKLQTAGAQAIIICANTPHLVYPYVAPKIEIPILHIADATAMEAKDKGLHKLGLLGTKATMEKDFLKTRFTKEHNIDILTPGMTAREEIHRIISEELTHGNFKDESKSLLIEEMEKLKLQGADGMILGCTELPLILENADFELPLLNTTELHAKMAINFMNS